MKHTQEEYLAFLDEWIEDCGDGSHSNFSNILRASLLANRDVLELHEKGEDSNETWCQECGEFRYYFPCPTVGLISNRLDEVMG